MQIFLRNYVPFTKILIINANIYEALNIYVNSYESYINPIGWYLYHTHFQDRK